MSTGAAAANVTPYASSLSHKTAQPSDVASAAVLPGQPFMMQPTQVSTGTLAHGAPTVRASDGQFITQHPNYSTAIRPNEAHHLNLAQSGQSVAHPKLTAAEFSINSTYLKTWQFAMRIARVGVSLGCLTSSALTISSYCVLFQFCIVPNGHAFSLATAVTAFVFNCGWLIFYLLSFNKKWPVAARRAVTAYNIVEMIFIFAAVTGISNLSLYMSSVCDSSYLCLTYNAGIQAYVEFGMINVAVCSVELYLNVTWWNGGPELIPLPFRTATSPNASITTAKGAAATADASAATAAAASAAHAEVPVTAEQQPQLNPSRVSAATTA